MDYSTTQLLISKLREKYEITYNQYDQLHGHDGNGIIV